MAEQDYVFRFSEPAAPTTWYYIGGTLGNPTSGTDTPANTYIPNNLLQMPSFKLMLFQGIDPKPDPVLAFGTLSLANSDGYLDQYMTKVFDGGTLQVLRGTKGAAVSTFSTVATFTTAGYLCDADSFNVRVRDLSHFLRESPLHELKYAGTGGVEGPAGLKGLDKPYTAGQVTNITPVFVDPTNLVFQVSHTAIQSVDSVLDGGASILYDTDYPTYAALIAAVISAGYYATCVASGLFRLGATPTRTVTCDVSGDKTGGSYTTLRGTLANYVVTRSAPALTAGQVSSSDVSALNSAYNAALSGFFWPDGSSSKAEALSRVLAGVCGYWYVDLTGVLRLGNLVKPTGTAAVTYTFPYEVDLPELVAYQVPRYKTRLLGSKNYTIMERSILATGLVSDVYQTLGVEGVWAEASTAAQRTYWPTSPIVNLDDSGFISGTGDSTEAARQQTMFQGVPTDSRNIELWAMRVHEDPFVLAGYLGNIVAVANMDRFSWTNPRKFNMVGIDWVGDLTPTIYLWG